MKHRILVLFLCLPFISQAKVLHVQGSKQLKEKIDQQPTVIKFSATWCGPCQMAKTPFKEISNMPEFSHVAFVGIDTDQQQSIASAYNITCLPTFVFVRNGSVVAKAEGLIGANNASGFKQNLAEKLNTLFAKQEQAPAELKEESTEIPTKKKKSTKKQLQQKEKKESNYEQTDLSLLDQIYNWLNNGLEYIKSLWNTEL